MTRNYVEAAHKRNDAFDPIGHIAAVHARNNGLAPKPTQGNDYVYPATATTPAATAQGEVWKSDDQNHYRSR